LARSPAASAALGAIAETRIQTRSEWRLMSRKFSRGLNGRGD
jgi:hypothetical protein